MGKEPMAPCEVEALDQNQPGLDSPAGELQMGQNAEKFDLTTRAGLPKYSTGGRCWCANPLDYLGHQSEEAQ